MPQTLQDKNINDPDAAQKFQEMAAACVVHDDRFGHGQLTFVHSVTKSWSTKINAQHTIHMERMVSQEVVVVDLKWMLPTSLPNSLVVVTHPLGSTSDRMAQEIEGARARIP